ncbi:MAG: hypothetical protein ACI8RZ_002205 [Myxococcota bacterium]|jgi:hypothetical protein
MPTLRLPDRYEALRPIGRGGNGEVRRVRDTVLERDLSILSDLPGVEVTVYEP